MRVGVCDLQDSDFESKLLKSVKKTGFAVLTNHDISHGLIKECQQTWREFFLKGLHFKKLYVNGNDTNMGYKEIGTETAVGSNIADVKEFFHWKPGYEIPSSAFKTTEFLFHELEKLGMNILRILQKETGVNYVNDCFASSNTLFRTLYYPALQEYDKKTASGAVRAAAHEDINHITLLVAASAPGLEVMDTDGNWYAVPHEESSITLNIGDMLQLASDGIFKSTTHRVVNPEDSASDRISMPLFIHPHQHTMLAPGITAGQFLDERISQIYGGKK